MVKLSVAGLSCSTAPVDVSRPAAFSMRIRSEYITLETLLVPVAHALGFWRKYGKKSRLAPCP